MSEFSSLTGKFRATTDGLRPFSSSEKVTKRPRESLVCNKCRKSKLRCDRGLPCSNCVKKGAASACSYQKFTTPQASNPVPSRHMTSEDRLDRLESMVKELIDNQTSQQADLNASPAQPATPPNQSQDRNLTDKGSIEGADPIRYVGSTHWAAVLDDICELKLSFRAMVTDNAQHPTTFEASKQEREPIFGESKQYSLQQIIAKFLPSKIETDRFLSIYFQGESFIVPFIHSYQFQRQYQNFCSNTANINPLWLSILFSICYMGSLIGGATESYRSSENESVNGRPELHLAAGQCLVLGRYHIPQKFTPEALGLYAQCKGLKDLDLSRESALVSSLAVRMAYEMGYHRDPEFHGQFGVFEAEMRRRFWACCKQIDLMLSFQLGLPGTVRLENCDTQSPKNLLDSDFDESTQILPASRPETEPTRLLWFIVKDRLMPCFSKVCQNALSFEEKPEAEIMALDSEIREMGATIPDVLRTRPMSDSIADTPFIILTRIYVEFIHLKSLLVLHRKYMARGNGFSARTCIEAGSKLVSQFIDMYKEFSPGGQLYGERWMLGTFTMNDFLLSVMVLCLVIHSRRKRRSRDSVSDCAIENNLIELLEQSHAICVEKSRASKDARRVSYAIRLTLDSSNLERSLEQTTPTVNSVPATSDMNMTYTQEHDTQAPSTMMGEEAVFGPFDPFNFLGFDAQHIDWSIVDE